MIRTTLLAALILVPGAAWAQQNDARAAAEILKRDNLVDTYCGDDASQPLPGFTEEATDEACDIVSSEDDD
ncbi:hypothetical protein SLNSH_19205 [Alsobacter soli]|uniref:Uncharacterized protein n=1 Tax=Alsobacter soli TaxID=2109933 RepID=A0A2T1HP31_9HYPH|nr:hypothetical protein [Alsobacter soli]PSC03396.1 hypothetical protein SLNSH_19205 [Alsobacter soli]